jgi:hypothetical protein
MVTPGLTIPLTVVRLRLSTAGADPVRGIRMWWWLVTLALAAGLWVYCLFMLDPAMLP